MRGFTLIEMLIGMAIVVILAAALFAGGTALFGGSSTISFGVNGLTEVRCINGYQFVIGEGGQARQIIDEFGKGARCETTSASR
jgi:prepilin-type N-terminal cleavage/methylation domain-containing protein